MTNSFAMRRLLLAATSLFAVAAFAQEKWVESHVTLGLTFAQAGEPQIEPGKNGVSTRVVPLEKFRMGNRDVLNALVSEGLITEIKGWSLVAIWAYWPDEDPVAGNTYRFYARKGSGDKRQTVAVPSYILNIAPLVAAVGVKHTLVGEEGAVRSGSETYQVYTQVRFNLGGLEGDPLGVQTGKGSYAKIADEEAGRYVPKTSKAALAGLFSRDGETAAGVITGSLGFGAGKLVNSYDYQAPSGTSYGSVSMTNSVIDFSSVQFASIWDVGVAGDDTAVFNVGAGRETSLFRRPSLPAYGTVHFGQAGELRLGTGEVRGIAAGDVLALSELTEEQRTGATWTPAP